MNDKEALGILEPTIKLYEKLSGNGDDVFVKAFKLAVEALKEKSYTAEKTAEWIIHKDTIGVTNEILYIFECSGCGKCVTEQSMYCPNCGSFMREGELK